MAADDVVPHMHQQDGADHQAMPSGAVPDFYDLVQAAFHVDRRFRHPGRLDQVRWHGGEACDVELVDVLGVLGCSGVHGHGDVVHHDVHDEFSGFLDVAQRVLALVGDAARGGEDHRGRVVGHGVEERIGGQVVDPIRGLGRHERDGPRHHHAGEDAIEVLKGVGVNLQSNTSIGNESSQTAATIIDARYSGWEMYGSFPRRAIVSLMESALLTLGIPAKAGIQGVWAIADFLVARPNRFPLSRE